MLNYKQPFGLAGRPPHGERGLKCLFALANDDIGHRSPHGERGLKFIPRKNIKTTFAVAPRTGGVD